MKKILIVDNQSWIVELFNLALGPDGYLASIEHDAERALEHVKVDRFDLVLLSLYLKYGYPSRDYARRLRQISIHPATKAGPRVCDQQLVGAKRTETKGGGHFRG
ncbi:MAG: hypothetical protein P8010_27040 [Desulfosarcinaceae bacterium]